VGALEWHEFRDLFQVLTETASLNRKVALGAEPGQKYGELSKRLEPIVLKMDEWRALIRFAGDLARTATDYPKALAYYKQALALSEEGEQAHDDLSRIIEETQTQVAAVSTTVTAPGSTRLTVDSDDPRMKRILESPATASILRLLGVHSREMMGAPTIAVFGGLPPEGSIPENQITLVGEATSRTPEDPMMGDYIATIVQTIRVVAPQAHFVFAGTVGKGGAFTTAEVLQSIAQLLSAQPKPDILLITVGPLRGDAEEKVLMNAAEAGVLVVLAAGNEPKQSIPFEGKSLQDRVMVVSATRQNGEPTAFTQRGDRSFWAPGETIPVMLKDVSQGEAGLTVRSGTTYAAALGAAVAARVISEKPALKLPDLIKVLRDTSKQAVPSGPKILNLEAALAS
jgi:subtilisin family serine protease